MQKSDNKECKRSMNARKAKKQKIQRLQTIWKRKNC